MRLQLVVPVQDAAGAATAPRMAGTCVELRLDSVELQGFGPFVERVVRVVVATSLLVVLCPLHVLQPSVTTESCHKQANSLLSIAHKPSTSLPWRAELPAVRSRLASCDGAE
jgi:hypothetical protein